MRPVFGSSDSVRAPSIVLRFCDTPKVPDVSSFTTVIVPFECVLNASLVAGLNAAPSELPASGSVARIWPSSALRMTICGMGGCVVAAPDRAQAAKSTCVRSSSARPLQPPPLSPKV